MLYGRISAVSNIHPLNVGIAVRSAETLGYHSFRVILTPVTFPHEYREDSPVASVLLEKYVTDEQVSVIADDAVVAKTIDEKEEEKLFRQQAEEKRQPVKGASLIWMRRPMDDIFPLRLLFPAGESADFKEPKRIHIRLPPYNKKPPKQRRPFLIIGVETHD